MVATKKDETQLDYQALRSELDTILDSLQSGELGIDEALDTYKRGQAIIKQLDTFLKETQNKIVKLKAMVPPVS